MIDPSRTAAAGPSAPPSDADAGHHDLVAQPHVDEEGSIAEAETAAAALSTEEQPLGKPGKPLNRRSPFLIGMTATAGAAVAVGGVVLLVTARDVLVLIGLALFVAIGLEPPVSWMAGRGLPRPAAVGMVVATLLAAVAGFVAAAVPLLIDQVTAFVEQVPLWVQDLGDNSSFLGQIEERFQIQQGLQQTLGGAGGAAVVGGLLSFGTIAVGVLVNTFAVLVLIVYFLADLPRIRRGIYRLVPHTRRPRTILIGDEVYSRIGAYVLGKFVISMIAGTVTFTWLTIFGVPYALLLAILVALLDLVPVIGPPLAAITTALVALQVSLVVALITLGFFIIYQQLEDHLLVPRIIGRAVQVPPLLTLVAVLLGAVLLGVIGAVVAIPIAAALLLILQEVVLPRLDKA